MLRYAGRASGPGPPDTDGLGTSPSTASGHPPSPLNRRHGPWYPSTTTPSLLYAPPPPHNPPTPPPSHPPTPLTRDWLSVWPTGGGRGVFSNFWVGCCPGTPSPPRGAGTFFGADGFTAAMCSWWGGLVKASFSPAVCYSPHFEAQYENAL